MQPMGKNKAVTNPVLVHDAVVEIDAGHQVMATQPAARADMLLAQSAI